MSPNNLATVFLAMPVIRTVARIELPSTRAAITRTRSSLVSLFTLTIMLEWSSIIKKIIDYFLPFLLCSTTSGAG